MKQARIKSLASYLLVGISFVFFGFQLRGIIRRYAVNILFFDQWDFLTPLFSTPSTWEMFTRQHGPHRQGLGLFVSQFVGTATNWDTRAESLVIGLILILACIAALILKKRLFGKLDVWDALIPAIMLSYTQIETVVLTPNPAHGALPLLLLIISGLLLTLENHYLRYFGLVFITFFATYTGFGFFLGVATPIVLAIAFLIHWINKEKNSLLIAGIALLVSIISFASFFIDYTFSPLQDCYQSPFSKIFDYFSFVSLEFSTPLGFCCMNTVSFAIASGAFLFFISLFFLFVQVSQLWKSKSYISKNIVIFLFITFTLLFAVNSTSGRICNGLAGAQSSRYVTLLIPGLLGIYFAAQNLSQIYWKTAVNFILAVLFILFPALGFSDFDKVLSQFTNVKKNWAACYRERENIEECNQIVGNVVYPEPEATHMKEKLDMLKEKRYNLFAAK